jgi:hypothetical protein
LWLMALLAGGLALVAGGMFLRRREVAITLDK